MNTQSNSNAGSGCPATSCSGFFVHGWAKAWSKIAFGNYMEAMERSRGRVEYGPNYRAYWAKQQTKARKRLNDAAQRSGAKLKFGTFHSVEIHIPRFYGWGSKTTEPLKEE